MCITAIARPPAGVCSPNVASCSVVQYEITFCHDSWTILPAAGASSTARPATCSSHTTCNTESPSTHPTSTSSSVSSPSGTVSSRQSQKSVASLVLVFGFTTSASAAGNCGWSMQPVPYLRCAGWTVTASEYFKQCASESGSGSGWKSASCTGPGCSKRSNSHELYPAVHDGGGGAAAAEAGRAGREVEACGQWEASDSEGVGRRSATESAADRNAERTSTRSLEGRVGSSGSVRSRRRVVSSDLSLSSAKCFQCQCAAVSPTLPPSSDGPALALQSFCTPTLGEIASWSWKEPRCLPRLGGRNDQSLG
mmetsp:Transcript_42317/g.99356  ORF Transcript_42317/g.99356 Transcript_42317/m.99356 type:complete len:309 (-) Transcript_42317:122-1048(-)